MQLRNVLVAVVLAADAVSAQTPADSQAVHPQSPSGDHVGYDRAGHDDGLSYLAIDDVVPPSTVTPTQSTSVSSTQSSSVTSTQSSSTTSAQSSPSYPVTYANATTVTVTVTANPQTVTMSVCPNVTYVQPQGPNGTFPPNTPINIVVGGASGVMASALAVLAAVVGAVYVGL